MWKDPTKPNTDLDAALKESIGGGKPASNGKVQKVKDNGVDIDAALKQSLIPQKKNGGDESTSVPQSTSTDNQPDNTSVENPFPTQSNPLPFQQKQTVITTQDGAQIPIRNSVPIIDRDAALQGIQERVNNKTATPDDIKLLANASGKSEDATQAYVNQGQKAGALMDNNDQVNKNRDSIVDFIGKYNAAYGSSYNPNDVLSSSKKLNDFLNLANKSTLQTTKETDITQPLSQQQLQRSSLQIGMTPVTNEMINQIIGKTIDEDKVAGVDKTQTINKIAQVINPKAYKEVQQASIPSIGDVVPNPISQIGDLFRDDKTEDELLNFQKGIAELKYNDALKQNAINKMSQGYVSGNQDLINQGQQDLKQVDDNVIDRYPALQKQEIVQRVNDVIARESGVVVGSDTENNGEHAFGASMQDRARVMEQLGYLDNPKTRDAAFSLLANPQLFADNSVLGSAASSFFEPFKNLGMSVGDIVGARNNKDIITDHLKDELFQKDFSGNNPDDPNVPHLKGEVRFPRTIVNTTANLAGMTAIASATEGIGVEAGLSINAAKQLGAYTSFGLPGFDVSLKDSKGIVNSEPAQYLYATINALAMAEGGRFLDLGKFTRIPGVSEVFSKASDDLTDKAITEEAFKATLDKGKNAYVDFALKFATKYPKNLIKGAATMAYFNITNNAVKMAFGDPNTTKQDVITQAGNAFLDGVLGMSIMGAFGAVVDMRNEKNTTYKGSIYNMSVNPDAAKDVFTLGLKTGQYTKPEYDQKIQILNTAVSAKNALDVTEQQTGTQLTQDQKAVYVANKTAQAVLKKQSEQSGISEETKSKYEGQQKKLAQQSQDILGGLKFTSTLEPLYNLFDAEKEYNAAKENYDPSNKASDDALLAAKDNYDKLYSDYLKDTPDDISSQSKTNTNEGSNKEGSQESGSQSSSQEGNAQNENGQEDVTNGGADETVPPIEDLKKVKLTGIEQKYKNVEVDDPVSGKTLKLSAQRAKTELEKRHDILTKLVNCLT